MPDVADIAFVRILHGFEPEEARSRGFGKDAGFVPEIFTQNEELNAQIRIGMENEPSIFAHAKT